MASILPGFEYDIFISYRHNDNRSGWVTEFVSALQEELAATIKDPITIYFDKNPHDGLLETHSVDKSLEGKIKCLIFIPIISQTYSDPKSFAWQQEFCAFNKIAKDDQFGRDIKLSNGNVASRILPIKIHDIDAEDRALFENELGGVLRAIEFIYKEAGVNRPLKPEDKREDNNTKAAYRNQVNKVANAIKEIISALKNLGTTKSKQGPVLEQSISLQQDTNNRKSKRNSIIAGVLILVAFLIIYFFYQFDNPQTEVAEADRSVAVLAFSDLSPNKDQEWFSDGLTEEILNSLANLHELKVTARTSSFYFKNKNIPLQEIAQKLGVANIVEGSVQRIGNKLRITAQLIRVKDESHIWSHRYDRLTDDLFAVQTDIAENIARELLKELTPEKHAKLVTSKPTNMEAYEYYLRGVKGYNDKFTASWKLSDFEETERYFLQALSLDPSYADTYAALAVLYSFRSLTTLKAETKYAELGDSLLRIGFRLNPYSVQTLCAYAWSFKNNPDSTFFYLRRAYRISPDTPETNDNIWEFYTGIGLNDLSMKFAHRLIELDPLSESGLGALSSNQLRLGSYNDAAKSALKLNELNKDNVNAHFILGIAFTYQGARMNALSHLEILRNINPNGVQAIYLEAILFAQEGKKVEALKLFKNNLRILSLLGMKKEFLTLADSLSKIKIIGDETTASGIFDFNSLLRNPIYNFVQDEPEFKIIFARVKKSYEEKLAKYGSLD